MRLRHKDGRRLTIHLTTAPLVVRGEPIGWLASIVDLTSRIEAEEALRRSEAKTRAILATTLSPFLLFDVEGRVLEVNDATCRMLGLPREEVVGRRIPDLVVGAPPGRIEGANREDDRREERPVRDAREDGRREARRRRGEPRATSRPRGGASSASCTT